MNVAALPLTLLIATTTSLKDVHIEAPASGYVFDAATGGASSDSITGQTRFLFRGHARASSKELEFRAETIKGVLYAPKGSKKPILRHADTVGNATVIRTIQNADGKGATRITGSRFVFDGDDKVGHLKVSGPVDIKDEGSGKSNLHMTGKNGVVELDMSKDTARNAFKKANLDGSVAVDVAGLKGSGTVHATGEHLVFDHTVSPATLVLSQNVTLHGQGTNLIGSAPGLTKVKFLLNDQGQWTRVKIGDETD